MFFWLFCWFVASAVVAVAVLSYWDRIRDWAVDLAHGWVRRTLGDNAERALIETVVRLDRVIVAGRRWVRRTVVARLGENRSEQTVVVEEVPEEDLPKSVRRELKHGSLHHTYHH